MDSTNFGGIQWSDSAGVCDTSRQSDSSIPRRLQRPPRAIEPKGPGGPSGWSQYQELQTKIPRGVDCLDREWPLPSANQPDAACREPEGKARGPQGH
ncbi:hypothetical protein CMUS01_09512 [Colletotrichum musicola]|uniref:Uncharacterized protein n=1 Tax=Colletotrichum musicola TaxID=2175873 RepID=A0A8H6K7P3_9PEZI|nr:hypothetical protein CMUS01_09512 [Colletotrichum musicola]